MSLPTRGDTYSALMESLRKAQEAAATLSHLDGLNDDRLSSLGWLTVSEGLKRMQWHVTTLATRRMQ